MQKFKVSKEELWAKFTIVDSAFYSKLPDFITLEGELLEGGGTVGVKCCGNFTNIPMEKGICVCPCHNKKEEIVSCGCAVCEKKFNRETTEEVKLPEMIDYGNVNVIDKINQILTYLASKENKWPIDSMPVMK